MKLHFSPAVQIALALSFFGMVSTHAEDVKDPAFRAKETSERAKQFLEEAEKITKSAATASGQVAKDLEKYAELTSREAEHLMEASEAWSRKQIRRAERAERKASELCAERGKMLQKVYPKHKEHEKPKLETPDASTKKDSPADSEKTSHSSDKKPLKESKPGKSDPLQTLEGQADQLGEN